MIDGFVNDKKAIVRLSKMFERQFRVLRIELFNRKARVRRNFARVDCNRNRLGADGE